MSGPEEGAMEPWQRVHDTERMLQAMRQGVREALIRHKKLGHPIAVWRNDHVEWIGPEDIEVED